MKEPQRAPPEGAIREALAAFFIATLLVALLAHVPIAFVSTNLHAFVAAIFLFLPQLVLRRRGDLEAYGFVAEPIGLGLRLAAACIFGVLPLFVVGFYAWNRFACVHLPSLVPGTCWQLLHPRFRVPDGLPMLVLAQLVVVALPEELFFRGYLMGRLEDALPPTRTLWGAKVGWAWILQSLLFGLGHFLVRFDPLMLTRAIPGLLFGWLFARTRSILAGTIFHAACNVLVEILAVTFFQ